MRKSGFIPKIVTAAIFLIVAVIISAPTFSVVFNRFLGGGIMDFNNAEVLKMWSNRPIEGQLYSILGCIGESLDESSGEASGIQKGSYYYLVPVGNSDEEEATQVMLVVTEASSQPYEQFNNLWRELSSSSGSEDIAVAGVELSGVIKENPEEAQACVDSFCKENGITNFELVPYMIDCTSSVTSICTRFYISLIFYAGFIISLYIIIRTIKKNKDYDYTQHRRAVTQSMQDVRSGANEPDNSDAMFGDSGNQYPSQQTAPQYQSQQGAQAQQWNQPQSSSNQPRSYDDDGFFGG